MQISVPSLRRGRHVFEFSEPADAYRDSLSVPVLGTIDVRAVVDKIQLQLLVRADVEADMQLTCARCLEPFEGPVAGRFEALFVPLRMDHVADSLAHRIERESERIEYYAAGLVELGDLAVEALELAVPIKPLCRGNCKGLCPSCGRNWNEGPCGCRGGEPFHTPFKGLFGRPT
jgi:uncharacterized metal-binding protein YceD (DUF177 family)